MGFFEKRSFGTKVPARALYEHELRKYQHAMLMWCDLADRDECSVFAEAIEKATKISIGDRMLCIADALLEPRVAIVRAVDPTRGRVKIHFLQWNVKDFTDPSSFSSQQLTSGSALPRSE